MNKITHINRVNSKSGKNTKRPILDSVGVFFDPFFSIPVIIESVDKEDKEEAENGEGWEVRGLLDEVPTDTVNFRGNYIQPKTNLLKLSLQTEDVKKFNINTKTVLIIEGQRFNLVNIYDDHTGITRGDLLCQKP